MSVLISFLSSMMGFVSTVLVVALKTAGLLAGKGGEEATATGCSITEFVELLASVRVSSEKGFH